MDVAVLGSALLAHGIWKQRRNRTTQQPTTIAEPKQDAAVTEALKSTMTRRSDLGPYIERTSELNTAEPIMRSRKPDQVDMRTSLLQRTEVGNKLNGTVYSESQYVPAMTAKELDQYRPATTLSEDLLVNHNAYTYTDNRTPNNSRLHAQRPQALLSAQQVKQRIAVKIQEARMGNRFNKRGHAAVPVETNIADSSLGSDERKARNTVSNCFVTVPQSSTKTENKVVHYEAHGVKRRLREHNYDDRAAVQHRLRSILQLDRKGVGSTLTKRTSEAPLVSQHADSRKEHGAYSGQIGLRVNAKYADGRAGVHTALERRHANEAPEGRTKAPRGDLRVPIVHADNTVEERKIVFGPQEQLY